MNPPTLRARLTAADDVVFGMWAAIPSTLTCELAGAAGYDYVCVDEQHGAAGPYEMLGMLQAVHAGGAAGLVRVADHSPQAITRALDLGALGVIVPMVEDAAQATAAAAACRYPPLGSRSYGPLRAAHTVGSSQPRDISDEPLCLVMVETARGLQAVEEIAAAPGIDGIYIGPSDLALALGVPPSLRLDEPVVLDALDRVRNACAAAGRLVGLHCLDSADAARAAGSGFRIVTVGVDSLVLRAGLTQGLQVARNGRTAAGVEGFDRQHAATTRVG